jgi:hypothetical protein
MFLLLFIFNILYFIFLNNQYFDIDRVLFNSRRSSTNVIEDKHIGTIYVILGAFSLYFFNA